MAFEDTLLLKLNREYSKEELVDFVLRRIKELKLSNGKNECYIQELVKENSELKAKLRNTKQRTNSIELSKKIERYKKNTKSQLEHIVRLKNEIKELKNKL